jgi:hypothetical protein
MSARAIIAIISICAVVTGGFLGIMFSMLMVEELDRSKQNTSKGSFPFIRWATLRTLRQYRELCPNGKLRIYLLASYLLATIGFICFALFMVAAYQPLAVRITSPADGAIFAAPARIIIDAAAGEGDRAVLRVDFYQGATILGSSTVPPYSVTWSNVPTGKYSLTAKATDERGTTTTSHAVCITVSAPGKTSP